MVLDTKTVDLCRPGGPTITEALARKPTSGVKAIAEELYPKPGKLSEGVARLKISKDHASMADSSKPGQEELDLAADQCGAFPSRPSDLFLSMYLAATRSLERNPLNGMVSPPLMGSSGVVPLSIISVIPDIMKHYAEVIVEAQHEVMLATNFWVAELLSHSLSLVNTSFQVASKSSKIITDAMLELSRRAEQRGKKVVFKLIYDRGNPKQVR